MWQSVIAPSPDDLRLHPDTRAPALARHHIRRYAEHLPTGVVNDAVLLTSELVSNAVEHGSGDIVLSVRIDDRRIGVRVHDDGEGTPVPAEAAPAEDDPHGRGLRIVSALATRWGIEFAADGGAGKSVWFVVDGE